MSSLCQNPELFICTCILYQNFIFSDSVSYFLEMGMLIILVGTLTQLRMGVGCVTCPGMGPGGVNMPYVKIQNVVHSWWTSAGKELISWLSACAVLLYAIIVFCVPFPYGVWGRKWNSIVSVPDRGLFIFFRPLITILGSTASYFLEMVMLVR